MAHYVDNQKFGQAVHDYVMKVKEAEASGSEIPRVTNYIGECFYKIAEGMTFTRKFIRRTYKDDLIMDAVENCLRAVNNYDINATTRTGKPNAFAYFTQIIYFSFLRTVEKHNKELKKKLKLMEVAAISVSLDPTAADSNEVLRYLDEVTAPYAEEAGVKKKNTKPQKLEKYIN